ncbi:hypothetical protein [Nocardiopsis sp. MG754419]|uniref:hypothetical protein n=1 Tax=Nocardiopsis sp. MG754419 TaxID=2259865 RepID=UPI001BA7CBBA|nr:hypothetical protein [Nocardiopsis sp. MG754419]MBR8744750.1 hypothetical protein [Nocardiopsis sp. MG754419]
MGFTSTGIDQFADKAVAAEQKGDLESARLFASLAQAKALSSIATALHHLNPERVGHFTDAEE